MADYYRILSGAIESQNISGEAERQALYARAKNALEAQFASMDQALVAEMVKTHHQKFEEAVAKIEGEIKAADSKSSPSPQIVAQVAAPVVSKAETESSLPPEQIATVPPQTPATQPQTESPPPQSPPPVQANSADSGDSIASGDDADQNTSSPALTPSSTPAPSPAPAVPPVGVGQSVASPSTPRASAYVAPAARTEPSLTAEPRLLAGTARQTPAGKTPREEKRRGAGAIVFAILFVLVAGGSAFGLWQRDLVAGYSDRLGEMTGLWGNSATQVATQEPANNVDSGTVSDMDAPMSEPPLAEDNNSQPEVSESSDNLGNSDVSVETSPTIQNPVVGNSRVGESAPVASPPPEIVPEPQELASNAQPEQDAAPSDPNNPPADESQAEPSADQPVAAPNVAEAPVESSQPSAVAESTAEANQQPETPAPVVSSPIELPLRAFFLVEKSTGGADPDARFNGGSKWRFDPNTKILHINSVFPLRNTELNIEIQANEDDSFPASHTVTYRHISLGEVPDGPIVNFPALMAREDAGAEGKPLKGAGALIVPNKYILGLSENSENVTHNIGLLHGARWLVVPVVFEIGGRRALFVIEKGPQGVRALAAALDAWGQTSLVGQ